jgi:hypothetical protein
VPSSGALEPAAATGAGHRGTQPSGQTAVQGVGGAGAALQGGGVADGGGGDHGDAVAGTAYPQAQVDVVADERDGGVEPADVVQDAAPDQHARRGDEQDVAPAVVLSLVDVAGAEVGEAAAAAGDGGADLDEGAGVVPAPLLAAGHGQRRGRPHHGQQLGEGVRLGCAVVVEQPHPLLARTGVPGVPGRRRRRSPVQRRPGLPGGAGPRRQTAGDRGAEPVARTRR